MARERREDMLLNGECEWSASKLQCTAVGRRTAEADWAEVNWAEVDWKRSRRVMALAVVRCAARSSRAALVSNFARVVRCDLGMRCHHLGPAGVLTLR